MQQRLFGIILVIIGVGLLFTTTPTLTGFAIADNPSTLILFRIAAVLIIVGGIILFSTAILTREAPVAESPLVSIINKCVREESRDACEILIDADFARYIHEHGDRLPDNFFGKYEHEITKRVYDEITHREGRTNQPLIPRKSLHYLTDRQGTRVMNSYTPTEEDKKVILKYWRQDTPQGKNTSNEERFIQSGDMEMLSYALHRGNKPTFILTNNYSEIGAIAQHLLRERGVHVFVIRPEQVFPSERAA